ncbi:Acidic repeat-containing protein [Eufriesea mexicana]|nr:Acidic repeat-containing protein [Eufriesea mexicana]
MQCDKKMGESLYGSQNFYLKVSQESIISDTQNLNSDDVDVIEISDSSSNSTCSINKNVTKLELISKKHLATKNNVSRIKNINVIHDSSDSDSICIEDEKYFQTWKANKKSYFLTKHQERQDIAKRNKILYTSDESSSDSIEYIKDYITSNKTSSSDCINSTTGKSIKGTSETNIQFHSDIAHRNKLLSNCTTNSSIDTSKSSSSNVQPSKSGFNKMLSREDAKNIIKNIQSTKIIYESPKISKINAILPNKEVDYNMIHPAISPQNNLEPNNVVIDETPVDSENDIIQNSQVDLTNPYKTRVSKFLDMENVEKGPRTCTELSERKKKQIAQWLMANVFDSQSDDSSGIVTCTNKDDISSGNSSLERLEMVYETPNNRGRIHHEPVSESPYTCQIKVKEPNCYNKPLSIVSHQTTMNEYIQKKNNNASELHKLKKNPTDNNMFPTLTNPTRNMPQNVVISDCADILDKLYGKSWRDRADVLFPKSEVRKQKIRIKSRAVQTERKMISKGRLDASKSDDDFNTSLKELKSQNVTTKRSVRKNTKQRDSFINDQTSSESGCESTYYTALTNPRLSKNSTESKPAAPPIIKRLMTICDEHSESENDTGNNNEICNIRSRKLSFNTDESEDSSTSEFDPGDEIPPKPTTKKDSTKTARQISKLNTRSKIPVDNPRYEKYNNNFLVSLNEDIPLAKAHPDAKKYRLDYKNTKETLCNYLYKLYNENVFDNELPKDMTIEWNVRMRGTAGFCYNKKSVKTLGGIVRSSRIVLATKVLDTPNRLRDTLIHEMCHAAAWLINGVSDGHGPFWTGWANKAMKTYPELPPIRRCHDYKIKTKFTYKCINCGYSIGRHSKSLDIKKKRCGHCYGKFELLVNKTTKSGTVQMQTPKRELSAFAAYVKENYNSVKKERNIKHGEVMKILGQQFSTIKIAKRQDNLENDPNTPIN